MAKALETKEWLILYMQLTNCIVLSNKRMKSIWLPVKLMRILPWISINVSWIRTLVAYLVSQVTSTGQGSKLIHIGHDLLQGYKMTFFHNLWNKSRVSENFYLFSSSGPRSIPGFGSRIETLSPGKVGGVIQKSCLQAVQRCTPPWMNSI